VSAPPRSTPSPRHRKSWPLRFAPALALALAVTGCGDPALWARWGADHDFWYARRAVERLQLNPRLATDADYAAAGAAFARIVARYPAARWAQASESPLAVDVGTVSGRAAIAVARIEELRGHADAALADYARAEDDFAALVPVALEAALARARALERADRGPESIAAWQRIAARYPLVDEARDEAILPVLDAPLKVAAARRAAGDAAGADSILGAAEVRFDDALTRARGHRAASDLWARLSQIRAARGRWDASLDALRSGLAEPAAAKLAPRLVLTLAERSVEAGRPDSALAYARWAESGFGGAVRPDAILFLAQLWERRGQTDSALVAYQRFLDSYSQVPRASAMARLHRGILLEAAGQWEQARTEYRALAAQQPTDPNGLDALLRIVVHHAARHETDLARLEGQRAIESLDQMITNQRDETVQFNARRAKADVLLAMGDGPRAADALEEMWRLYPNTAVGIGAALRAADVAERDLHDRGRAVTLYQQIEGGARSADAQRRARAALDRLGEARR
jgi:tetratricopeptide (TPR) repeat protein